MAGGIIGLDEMPEHFLMPVNVNGDGPVPDSEAHHFVCGCGRSGDPVVQKFDGGRGAILCPDTRRIIAYGFLPHPE